MNGGLIIHGTAYARERVVVRVLCVVEEEGVLEVLREQEIWGVRGRKGERARSIGALKRIVSS